MESIICDQVWILAKSKGEEGEGGERARKLQNVNKGSACCFETPIYGIT